MKLNMKLCLALVILFFISVSAVSAAGNDTDRLSETFSDFQSEIDNVTGDTINLKNDYTYDTDFSKNGITVNKSITINGNGKTFDGKDSARIFNITADNVVINDLIFKNAYVKVDENAPDNGAAIYCTGTNLVINNCTFIDNSGGCHGGGAVYIESDGSTINDSTFSKNTGSNSGGAVKITGQNHTIANNVFEENTAKIRHGGALYIVADNVKVINNTFTANVAKYSGGAFRIVGDNSEVSKNRFTNNIARETLGGAVSILGNTAQVTDNYFEKNYAGRDGGAVDIEGSVVDTNSLDSTVKNNIFIENEAGEYGGGLSANIKNCAIENNTFSKNTAGKLGGAFRVTGASENTANITENTVEDNYAGVSGGGCYIKGNGTIIDSNTFKNNTAATTAGGAVNVHGNDTKITNNEFVSNNASSIGGAIYSDGDGVTVSSNTFTNNTANSGTSIYGEGIGDTLTKNSFVGSKAANEIIWKPMTTKLTSKATTVVVTLSQKTLTATLKDLTGNLLKGKTVYFTINGKTHKATTTAKGVATVKLTLNNVKSYPVTVKFKGDANYKEASASTTLKITKEKTKITAPTKKFKRAKVKKITITLKSKSGKALSKKKITLRVYGKNYKGTTNSKGKVTIKVKLTKRAKYTYKVTFKGDSKYYSITKKGIITVR